MAEEEETVEEVSDLPSMEEVCTSYGSNPSGDKEGNHYKFSLTNNEEDGSKFEFSHKSCFLPSATAPFAGTWISNTTVFKGTWTIAEGEPEAPPVVETKEEEKTEGGEEGGDEGKTEGGVEEGKTEGGEETEAKVEEPPKPTVEITCQCETQSLEGVVDGEGEYQKFEMQDQPCTKYSWKFKYSAEEGLTLLESNYPVSLTSARWESGSTIEMKYMDLTLPKA